MAVYRPTYKDSTGKMKHSKVWWINFTIAGKRVQESTDSKRKTIAVEYEKRRRMDMERALAGLPSEKPGERIRTVQSITGTYEKRYGLNHRPASIAFVKSSLKHVNKILGATMLHDLTEDRIFDYIERRLDEEAAGRSINAELGELSRAIGTPWKALWPKVRKLEENHDVGKALTSDEESRLVEAAGRNRSPNIRTLIRLALMTGIRAGELTSLQWGQVDFEEKTIIIGKAKTESGSGRIIPMGQEVFEVLTAHAAWFTKKFGASRTDLYLFPHGSPYPTDPTRPTVELKTAWDTIRTNAKVECRWHDFRHTACTKMAEGGVPESTMLAIMGHMSRKMLERYSHIRMKAKREAVETMGLRKVEAKDEANSNAAAKDSAKVAQSALIN